jgi:hypothetical protein
VPGIRALVNGQYGVTLPFARLVPKVESEEPLLRLAVLTVLGFGEERTPQAFRNACHKFVLTEVLRSSTAAEPVSPPPKTTARQNSSPATVPKLELPKQFLLSALEQSIDDSGWAHLGTFGSYEERQAPGANQKVLYLRSK